MNIGLCQLYFENMKLIPVIKAIKYGLYIMEYLLPKYLQQNHVSYKMDRIIAIKNL